jgi:hypothetical protein
MANKDASFGLKPVKMMGGSPYSGGQSRYRIAANYGTNIFQGDLVMQVTGGGIEIHADGGTVPIVGVFNGCMFTDPTTSEQVFSNLDVTTGATTTTLPLKAIDISQDPENSDVGSANTNVLVVIQNHIAGVKGAGLA